MRYSEVYIKEGAPPQVQYQVQVQYKSGATSAEQCYCEKVSLRHPPPPSATLNHPPQAVLSSA